VITDSSDHYPQDPKNSGESLRESMFLEAKPSFRADTDQGGDWWVWRRLSSNGWATHQRCGNREAACELASELNRSSIDVA